MPVTKKARVLGSADTIRSLEESRTPSLFAFIPIQRHVSIKRSQKAAPVDVRTCFVTLAEKNNTQTVAANVRLVALLVKTKNMNALTSLKQAIMERLYLFCIFIVILILLIFPINQCAYSNNR